MASNPIPQTGDPKPVINVINVTKRFGDNVVIDGVSLKVYPGEVVAIIGPSGCGKSTLLRLISDLDTPDEGIIERASENQALVFQYSALFDSLTVYENVAFSLIEKPDFPTSNEKRHKTYTEDELHLIVDEKLALLGLHDVEHLYPSELSGGMQKRVSFARAIVSDPDIILYDEPTAGLDPIASTMIEDYILNLSKQTCATSIVVTHQFSTIQRTANRVCLLFEGQLRWEGSTKELFTTDNEYARQFAQASLDGPMTVEA